MDNQTQFAERFSYLISESNSTQKQLANAIGIKETSISNYKKGLSEPSIKHLVAIADYYKCSTDYLIGKTDDLNEKEFNACPPFYLRLQTLLKQNNISAYKFCKDNNLPQGSFYDWKNGKAEPNLFNLTKLSKIFDYSLDYLLGREK